jgi:hypothetical protein
VFDLRKKGPTRPFAHADNCKLVKAEPVVETRGRRSKVDIGRQSASAGPRTTTRGPPTVVLGSTPLTRPPSATRGVRASGHERSGSPPGNLEDSGRRGRGLLVGGVRHLRMRLAGSALCRGGRGVTTNPLRRRYRDEDGTVVARQIARLEGRRSASIAPAAEGGSSRLLRFQEILETGPDPSLHAATHAPDERAH